MPKLPTFSGYCPPGQLRSMTRRLATTALKAKQRRQWLRSELPATDMATDRYLYLALVAVAALLLAFAGPLLAKHAPKAQAPTEADFPAEVPRGLSGAHTLYSS